MLYKREPTKEALLKLVFIKLALFNDKQSNEAFIKFVEGRCK